MDFEVFGWFRDDGDVARNGDEVVAELLHAERLIGDVMEAGEDEEVAIFVEADDGRVDAPFYCSLGAVGPGVPGGATSYTSWLVIQFSSRYIKE